MIADKDTNFVYFSELLRTDLRFKATAKQITDILDSFGVKHTFLLGTKDIWARDFMPIQISDKKYIEYRYDPDYLQGTGKDRREIKTYSDIVCDLINIKTTKTDIVLDGGNVIKSSNAIILTDKVLEENKRIYKKKQLLDKLHELFEVDKVVLIPWNKKCEFGHSDGMLRFINDDTVLISGFYNEADENSKELIIKSLKQNKLNWEWLKCTGNEENEQNIAYINFLQTSDLILIPKLNIEEDNKAFEQIEKYYPDYAKNKRIAQVDMTEIVKYGGALNCITWTIKN